MRGVVFSVCCLVRSAVAYPGLSGAHRPVIFGRLVKCTGFGKRGAYHVEASCCMYGTRWRKALTFLAGNLAQGTIFLSCDPFKGICERTGQRHWHLHGRDVHGSLWTDRADPWPHALQIAYPVVFGTTLLYSGLWSRSFFLRVQAKALRASFCRSNSDS